MTDYLVNLNSPGSYSVGVDYEIPSKSTQNTNLIIDDINGQFNGIGVTFALNSGGNTYSPLNDQQLIVCKNNLVMEPGEDFTISGDQLIFSVAPVVGDDVFIIALATTADLTRSVNFVIDSGSQVISPGSKGKVTVDVSGTIESIKVLSDQTGDIVLEVSKSNFQDFPTFTTITDSQRVQLQSQDKYIDDVLNNWDKTIVAGDILDFSVISSTNIRRLLISLKLKL
jgi:hypothetical protein